MVILSIQCFPGVTRTVVDQHKKPLYKKKGKIREILCRVGKNVISQKEANNYLCKLRRATEGTC